jgi:hypothetical protein
MLVGKESKYTIANLHLLIVMPDHSLESSFSGYPNFLKRSNQISIIGGISRLLSIILYVTEEKSNESDDKFFRRWIILTGGSKVVL